LGADNVGSDGTNNRDYNFWLKLPEYLAETNLALGAGLLALPRVQSIHWSST
jgi:hypothetical protein